MSPVFVLCQFKRQTPTTRCHMSASHRLVLPSGLTVSRYANWDLPASEPLRPLHIVFLTSVRDTGACDRNGQNLRYPDGTRYMRGVIEATVLACRPGGMLHGLAEVGLVITDDHPTDTLERYSVAPQAGRQWLHPPDLRLLNGERVIDWTINVPSLFRKLPRRATAARVEAKLAFEQAVLARFKEAEGDVLISDHYMARLEHLFGDDMLSGRVLNIHPAITARSSPYCLRGPTPTADAIQRAASQTTYTGATLHFVSAEIDDGPAIAVAQGTPVHMSDRPQQLRDRNYRLAKVPLLSAGLRHYALRLFPHLPCYGGQLNIGALEQR